MNSLRSSSFKSVFIIFWCLAFLNMSFFMAEVSVLELNCSKELMENAKKLLATSTNEEETDSAESSEGRYAKIIDILINNSNHDHYETLAISLLLKGHTVIGGTHTGHSEKYSPPPDFLS